MHIAYFQARCGGPRPRIALRTASALILSAFAASTHAADTSQPLSAVVVSASRFPNDPAFPPVAATVITAEQIREAGIDNANEAIRKLGGVYGRQSLSGPRDFPLDLRGFGTNGDQNMVVLVDGVRISENELATPLLSAIPIETIERIEIVRGGSSVLYGSGATGGTIQIITRRPQANTVRGTVIGEVGSNGQRAGRAAVSRGWDNMSIDASYAKSHADNWRDNSKSNQENFSTTVQWFASDWRFGLRANLSRADFGLPGSLSQAQYDANARQTSKPLDHGSYDNDSITAFLERRFGAFDAAAELSHREKISRSTYVSSASAAQANIRTTQFSPRLRHVLDSGLWKNEAIAGVDLAEWSSATNASYGNSDASQHSKALYLRDEIEFDRNARVAAGVRREQFTQQSDSGAYGRTSAVNAWDLQASYAPLPLLRGFVKTGQSYRLATADENGFTALPSGAVLKPQVSHDLELGATLGNTARQVTLRWFRHRVRDELYYDPTANGGFGANSNLAPTRHQGVELEGRVQLTETLGWSATYQHINARFEEGDNSGKQLALVPANTLSTRLNWKSGQQSADVGAHWVDRQRMGNDFANTCARMPSFTTFDARYAVRVSAWEFAVTGTNLADRKYYSQAYDCSGGAVSGIYPEDGRALKFTARYDFWCWPDPGPDATLPARAVHLAAAVPAGLVGGGAVRQYWLFASFGLRRPGGDAAVAARATRADRLCRGRRAGPVGGADAGTVAQSAGRSLCIGLVGRFGGRGLAGHAGSPAAGLAGTGRHGTRRLAGRGARDAAAVRAGASLAAASGGVSLVVQPAPVADGCDAGSGIRCADFAGAVDCAGCAVARHGVLADRRPRRCAPAAVDGACAADGDVMELASCAFAQSAGTRRCLCAVAGRAGDAPARDAAVCCGGLHGQCRGDGGDHRLRRTGGAAWLAPAGWQWPAPAAAGLRPGRRGHADARGSAGAYRGGTGATAGGSDHGTGGRANVPVAAGAEPPMTNMTHSSVPVLQTRQLAVCAGARVLLQGLDWQVRAGEFWCVLGRNGVGKSSLLHVLAGLQAAHAGEVLLQGRALSSFSPSQLALQRGLLLQHQQDAFSLPVLDAVMAGRFAHGDGWGGPEKDSALALSALEQVGLSGLAGQDLLRLSGGERQRVALATLLVQAPALCLLDEPTSHQDIAAQLQVMQLLQEWAQEGRAVVASCHDINLARRFASHILLLDGSTAHGGTAEAILQPAALEAAYGCRFFPVASPDGMVFVASQGEQEKRKVWRKLRILICWYVVFQQKSSKNQQKTLYQYLRILTCRYNCRRGKPWRSTDNYLGISGMKKNIAAAVAAIAAIMAAGSVAAQTVDSGVYIGLEGGVATISSIATPTNGVKTSETNETGALRALVGYQINKNFAIELGYFATDDFKQDGTNRTGTVRYNVKADVKGADLSVIYKFTEFVPGLYLKAGATRSKVSLELSQPSGTSSFSQTGTGYLYGLGYEFAVAKNVGINVGYTRFEKLGGESDNKMNLYSAGVKYKF